jgi:predicted dehydrogenase
MDRRAELRAVVVGTSFGCRVHVPALRAAGFDVVALVGRDPERTARRAERAGVAHGVASLREAIELGADAVTVASPPATHSALAREAIAAGCHVLVEKPFTLDTGEARVLLDEAESAGVVHLIGHEFRWSPGRSVPARALAAGVVGEPRVATFVSWVPFVPDPQTRMQAWWWDPAQGGGWLGASGSHIIDQIRTWLGEVESVSAGLSVVSDRPRSGAEDSFTARMRMRSGCEVTFQQTAAAWGPVGSLTAVAGPLGTLSVTGDEVSVADRTGIRRLEVADDLRLPDPPGVDRDDPRYAFQHLELPPAIRLAEHFRDRILGAELPADPTGATFYDGVAAMEVLDAIRRSAMAGGALEPVAAPPRPPARPGGRG